MAPAAVAGAEPVADASRSRLFPKEAGAGSAAASKAGNANGGSRRALGDAHRSAREQGKAAKQERSERRMLQPIWDLRSEPRTPAAAPQVSDGVPANPY
jgi:hypothetical protein